MRNKAAMMLRDRASAEGYVASICFKHGPPQRYGVELEWTVHHADDPCRPLDASLLRRALGPFAPTTLAAPDAGYGPPSETPPPLPHGSLLTVEPGGQVELSTTPHDTVAGLLYAAEGDAAHIDSLLAEHGLVCGNEALDVQRAPNLLVAAPRYAAMERAFDAFGPQGTRMMCNTAGLQVCLDAGTPDRISARWAALYGLGPVMVAMFANSAAVAEDGQAWESGRMRAVLETDPYRMRPFTPTADPAADYAAFALDTPLLCLRRPDGSWDAPAGVTFADWVDGALPVPPTTDDLDYHLSTLFPPVRPRGYLEVRYLDAQAGSTWTTPVALLAALMSDEHLVDAVVEATASTHRLWWEAARCGLAHPDIARAAHHVLDLGIEAMDALDLPATLSAQILTELAHRRAALVPTRR
jgi:glutamate--cysteine ligase